MNFKDSSHRVVHAVSPCSASLAWARLQLVLCSCTESPGTGFKGTSNNSTQVARCEVSPYYDLGPLDIGLNPTQTKRHGRSRTREFLEQIAGEQSFKVAQPR